jgi:hypothetical protein
MAMLLKTTGELVAVTPADGVAFTLAEMQRLVGDHIEIMRAPGTPLIREWVDDDEPRWLVVNEDGKHLQLPKNMMATYLYHAAGGLPEDIVLGDVVLGTWTEIGGNA